MNDLHKAYVNLHAASLRQLDALRQDDHEAFERATDERDGLFAALQQRAGELGSSDARTREAIRATIADILASDEALQAMLAAASERTLQELQLVTTGLAALNSYGGGEATLPARFIDRAH